SWSRWASRGPSSARPCTPGSSRSQRRWMSRATDGPGDQGTAAAPSAAANTGDSAGVPWAGRSFQANPGSGDDGSADPALLDALLRFRSGDGSQVEVVDAFRSARVLVPLVAE